MADTKQSFIDSKLLHYVAVALVGGGAVTGGNFLSSDDLDRIEDRIDGLERYHMNEWPLERQLMAFEQAQLESRIAVNEANIEELENEVRELR